MSDAVIKSFVIRNLVDEEQIHLRKMQEEDAQVKMDFISGEDTVENYIFDSLNGFNLFN